VVGGGIAGLTTAYLLSRAGQAVVVLERGEIGSGETGRTTAHLVNALDDRYSELARLHGEDGARLAADSHTKAIDQVEAIVTLEHIACEFERLDGYVFVPPGEDASILDEELEAAHRAGVNAVHLVARTPWQTFETGPALCFPRQAQFHPMKYLVGLTQATESHGGRIHTGTHATEIKGGPQATIVLSGLHAPGMRRPVEQY
jgi:glycine/D-amino acid oxidase-like deaminating enzyme